MVESALLIVAATEALAEVAAVAVLVVFEATLLETLLSPIPEVVIAFVLTLVPPPLAILQVVAVAPALPTEEFKTLRVAASTKGYRCCTLWLGFKRSGVLQN